MSFQCILPGKILFEIGSSKNLGKIIKNNYFKPLILTGGGSINKSGNYNDITDSLKINDIEFFEFSGVNKEPTPEIIDEIVDFAETKNVKSIISIGGGSVIDTGKAAAVLINNKKGVENYLEGVGKGFKLEKTGVPFIALPTTAGSGAEATYNSVVSSFKKKYKKSFRDERLLAEIIIIDPLLTMTLPLQQTMFSGMDAICQLIESFVSRKRKPYPCALASYYIPKAVKALFALNTQIDNMDARSIMCEASLASGIALANSGLGAVHGFASGIGGAYNIPHGLICAVLLPAVCEKNAEKNPELYNELSRLISNNNESDYFEFIDFLYNFNKKLGIPDDFKEFDIGKDKALDIVKLSMGGSMSGNPVEFNPEEWAEFIEKFL
ncbi:MAG: iron-containing alcohol dehydrogenase [Spirochaetes bacterium]|nr:iron-containing alcohol dehydrogenase [Spirochaetota bacterium]